MHSHTAAAGKAVAGRQAAAVGQSRTGSEPDPELGLKLRSELLLPLLQGARAIMCSMLEIKVGGTM